MVLKSEIKIVVHLIMNHIEDKLHIHKIFTETISLKQLQSQ